MLHCQATRSQHSKRQWEQPPYARYSTSLIDVDKVQPDVALVVQSQGYSSRIRAGMFRLLSLEVGL